MRIATLTIASLLTLSTAHQAMAEDGVTIEPGLWEVSTTMTTPMSPKPLIQTEQECIKDSKISPQDIAPSDNGECSMSDINVSSNTLSWSMQCNTPGGAMNGQGAFESKGDSGSGNMTMNMNIEGQSFSMEMVWKGHRVGSC
jgi:hypothetical protein